MRCPIKLNSGIEIRDFETLLTIDAGSIQALNDASPVRSAEESAATLLSIAKSLGGKGTDEAPLKRLSEKLFGKHAPAIVEWASSEMIRAEEKISNGTISEQKVNKYFRERRRSQLKLEENLFKKINEYMGSFPGRQKMSSFEQSFLDSDLVYGSLFQFLPPKVKCRSDKHASDYTRSLQSLRKHLMVRIPVLRQPAQLPDELIWNSARYYREFQRVIFLSANTWRENGDRICQPKRLTKNLVCDFAAQLLALYHGPNQFARLKGRLEMYRA